ncbi:MAG: transposase family protein [Deltaproteobacteria bacterium]|nr:transposase family protein [Deltaproteobacteria bacterium]
MSCQSCDRLGATTSTDHERMIRDPDIFSSRTVIHYQYRKVRCRSCGVVTERVVARTKIPLSGH